MRRLHVDQIVFLALVLLAGVGVAVNDYSASSGFRYWLAMAPVFGSVSVVAAWLRARRAARPVGPLLRVQALQWLGATGAVCLVYLLQRTGRMQDEAAGLAALVTLALACFVAGVHSDWRVSLLGIVLGLTVIAFAVLEEILWLVILPVLALAVIVAFVAVRRRAGAAADPSG